MKNDEVIKAVNRLGGTHNTTDVIAAIERHQKGKVQEQYPKIHDLLNEKPEALLDHIGVELKKHIIKTMMEEILFSRKKFSGTEETQQDDEEEYEYIKEILTSNLIDDEKRDRLLETALLKEIHTGYLLDQKKRIIDDAFSKLRLRLDSYVSHDTIQDLLKPSHIRKESRQQAIELFSFQQEFAKKKKLTLVKTALDVNKWKTELSEASRLNFETLKCILSFNKGQTRRNKKSIEFECARNLRRIFIMSSTRDMLEDEYFMKFDQFMSCFRNLDIIPDEVPEEQMINIWRDESKRFKNAADKDLEVIDYYKFLEVLQIIAPSIIEDYGDEEEEVEDDLLILFFYKHFLKDHVPRFKHRYHSALELPHIKSFIQRQTESHHYLFKYLTRKKQKTDLFEAPQEPMLTFGRIFDIFPILQLFPSKCERQHLRFFYDYCAPDENGLDLEDFDRFFPLVGMDIVERHLVAEKYKQMKTTKDIFAQFIQDSSKKKQEKEREEKEKEEKMLDPLQLLKVFYTSKEFLGDFESVREKIKSYEDDRIKKEIPHEEIFQTKNPFTESILAYLNTGAIK